MAITVALLLLVHAPFGERFPQAKALATSVISGAFGGKGNCLAKVGFGRVVASEREAPIPLVNLV